MPVPVVDRSCSPMKREPLYVHIKIGLLDRGVCCEMLMRPAWKSPQLRTWRNDCLVYHEKLNKISAVAAGVSLRPRPTSRSACRTSYRRHPSGHPNGLVRNPLGSSMLLSRLDPGGAAPARAGRARDAYFAFCQAVHMPGPHAVLLGRYLGRRRALLHVDGRHFYEDAPAASCMRP
jgi:hypothetical protein